MDKWQVITKQSQIVNPGIYQEKFIIICADKNMSEILKRMCMKEYPYADSCDVPKEILSNYPNSFGYWVNKHDPKCTLMDLKNGSIRMKIK